jgi:lipocalin|uniref:Lipocalin/cytosolic fatty-acid binding domain-containing protein n=1 Tax=viral metagenome TaxID=1070528 RepID=A0A6C0CLF9_9ZZZZ
MSIPDSNTLFFTLALMCAFFAYSCFAQEYKPVNSLDLNSYDGRWYQVYKDLSDMSFQGFGTCAVADYLILDANNISVLNSQIDKDGTLDQITGFAFYSDGNSGGELTVDLDGTPGNAPYWVIEVGPVINNEYQYSIVSDNLKVSLFVLARNVTEFYDLYDKDVKKSLEQYGFTKNINKPIVMEQIDCDYSVYDNDKNNVLKYNKNSECQVANYLKKSGFSESSIPTMVCISKYESSYNCDATNKNNDGSTDYGLFQINSYYWCSGDPNSKYNECGTSCTSLFDCQKNSNCAYKVYREQGYSAWYGYQYHKQECDSYKLDC